MINTGVKSDDLNLTVENDLLTLSAEKKDEFEDNRDGLYRRERSFGKVTRSFKLGNQVDVEKIDAEFRDGVLKVTLPKLEAAKPRTLKVKVM